MKIAVIGGGLTGLTAAYDLIKHGHQVTVFEKEKTIGGLAGGFKQANWKWHLEYFYHHFFTNDDAIISLAKELELEKDIIIKRPVTATLTSCHSCPASGCGVDSSRNPGSHNSDGIPHQVRDDTHKVFQLDSPLNLLTFPLLSHLDKLRTGALLAFCKLNPFWKPLEKITAEHFFKTIGGTRAWVTLWEPLMNGKFGRYAKGVPASWLWARFHKRTTRLGYFCGGFQTFVDTLASAIKIRGGDIRIMYHVSRITYQKNNNHLAFSIGHLTFDRVLLTTPSSIAAKLVQFPKPYEQTLKTIPHLFAQTLILETKKPILDKTYWLNINDRSFPFLAVVQHTNMIDKKWYGGHHITYIANYLPEGHPYLKMTKQQLLKKFIPYLQKINSQHTSRFSLLTSHLFTASSAQPVHTLNYSKKAPSIRTPIEAVYLANLDSIYPWDRGTNYAVELGHQAASLIR